MKKWIIWTVLGTLVVAVIMHLITITAVPIMIMDTTMAKYATNVLLRGQKTNAQSRGVVRPSPDLVYSIVSYDVSKEPIRLSAKVPTDFYWSLSCFQQNSDNFFVVNDRQAKSNPVEIVLAKQGTQVTDAGNAQVVFSPTDRGILLMRYLLTGDDKYQDLVTVQKQASLTTGSAPAAPTGSPSTSTTPGTGATVKTPESGLSFEAAEYINPTYGFSIKYPKAWKEGATTGKQVFVAAGAARVPSISISVRDESTFADAVKTALTDTGSTGINIGTEKAIKLADGTATVQSVLKFKLKAGYDADALSMGIQKDGKIILVIVATVGLAAPYDEAQFSQILGTFQFKK
jgi:uncharacterized membrane protein